MEKCPKNSSGEKGLNLIGGTQAGGGRTAPATLAKWTSTTCVSTK